MSEWFKEQIGKVVMLGTTAGQTAEGVLIKVDSDGLMIDRKLDIVVVPWRCLDCFSVEKVILPVVLPAEAEGEETPETPAKKKRDNWAGNVEYTG